MAKYKEVILIDGRNFVYRHAFTRASLFSRGRPSGGIYGALAGLIRLNRFFPDAAIVFCWDGDNADKSWRHKLDLSYKANRNVKGKPIPKEILFIRSQIPIIEKFIKEFGFKSFSVPTLEADDLIGILSTGLKKKYNKIIIYSTDKDFYQLIKDNVCVVRDLEKDDKCKEFTDKQIKKKWGVTSRHWLQYRALVGEKTDNIAAPIKKVGPKTAIKMLKAGVDPSQKEPHPDYKEHWAKIRLCYQLTKIVRKPDDARLHKKSIKQIQNILAFCLRNSLFRDDESKTKQKFRKMMTFISDYELQDIIERRHHLWRIK